MSSPPEETETRIVTVPYSLSFLACASSKVVVDAVFYPFDTIKTRLQSSEGLLKSGGFRSCYRGLLPASVGCFPTVALSLYLHQSSFAPSETSANIAFGIGTYTKELAASFIHVPFEVVKQRRQTEATPTRQLLKGAFRNEGIFGIYRGFCSTALLDFSVLSLSIPLFGLFSLIYLKLVERPLNNAEMFACGYAGGSVSAFLTTPLDVAKTRIMLYKISEDSISSSRRIPSLISTLRTIHYEQGLKGIFAGGLIRTTILPVGSAMFSVLYFYSVLQAGLIYASITEDDSD